MITKMLEVGVAVKDVRESAGKFQRVFGACRGEIIHVAEYEMRMQMFRVGNVAFELMEPTGKNSVIARFLKNRGEGFHHIAFQVEDVKQSIKCVKKHGVKVINEEPVLMRSLKAVFLHPESLGGVLIELIEGEPEWFRGCVLPGGMETKCESSGIQAERIAEVAIAVRDLEASKAMYTNVFSVRSSETIELSELGYRMTAFRLGDVLVRLLEAEVGRRMKDAGETTGNFAGIHHVTVKARNMQDAIWHLNRNNIMCAWDATGNGFGKGPLAIDAKHLSGALIMIV